MTPATATVWNVALFTALLLGLVVWSVRRVRSGRPVEVRSLRGVRAVFEAVEQAAASGRPVLFVTGVRDLDNMQTVAGLSILEPVARTCAEQGVELLVPVNRSLVMEEARAACRRGFASAGREHAWDDDNVNYISDDQLGFVARVDGMIARERPGACFFFGFFASESLLLAEGGRQVGAVQVAGTASPVQLPFFVAACDHTLMGEELFAAGASMSGDSALLGSLRGQDLGRMVAVGLILAGTVVATLAAVAPWPWAAALRDALGVLLETR